MYPKNRTSKPLILAQLLTLSAACSSTITLKSDPPATIRAVSLETGEPGSIIGKTPLTIEKDKLFSGSSFATVRFERKGFEPHLLTIPSAWDRGEFKIRLNTLSKSLASEDQKGDQTYEDNAYDREIKEMFYHIMKIQKALAKGDVVQASSDLSTLSSKNIPRSIISLLRGNIAYVKGDRKSALSLYETALAEDPKQDDLRAVIRKIKKSLK